MTRPELIRTTALAVVIPVHNEEELLGSALRALEAALADVREWELDLHVVVVLDSCVDDSFRLVAQWRRELIARTQPVGVTMTRCDERNVGFARRKGCARALEEMASVNPANIWLAMTDADSRVPVEWLASQVLAHEAGVDIWSGRVAVGECSADRRETMTEWSTLYERERQPIHGTNLGFNGAAYGAAGGFAPLMTGEDRHLYRALVATGAVPRYDSEVRVLTSARRSARSPFGFAHALDQIEARMDSNARS